MEREMAADMEGWRGNFGNEIIKQWIVHERDIFLGNSGHILGYANLGYEKAITPKWADQNTVFPSKKLKIYIRSWLGIYATQKPTYKNLISNILVLNL